MKPELLEKLLKFNVFLLILSFSLFLNLYTEMLYNFSILNIKSIDDWAQKEINSIDLVYVFTFYCLFITGGMHFFRFLVRGLLAKTGLLKLFINEKDKDKEGKIHINEFHRISIKFNNMAAFKTYKDRLIDKNEVEKVQLLCQSIAVLILVTFVMYGFSIPYLLIKEVNELNLALYLLINLISFLIPVFIFSLSVHSLDHLSYVDKSLIQPFLDEEAEQIKLKNEANHYEF